MAIYIHTCRYELTLQATANPAKIGQWDMQVALTIGHNVHVHIYIYICITRNGDILS